MWVRGIVPASAGTNVLGTLMEKSQETANFLVWDHKHRRLPHMPKYIENLADKSKLYSKQEVYLNTQGQGRERVH